MDWMSSIVEPIVGGVAKGLTQSFAPGASGGGGGGGPASVPKPEFSGFMAKMSDTKTSGPESLPAPVSNTDAVTARWVALLQGAGQK